MKINLHTHTSRCHHAYGSDEQYVLRAIETNMNILGFSDHVPFKHVEHSKIRMDLSEKEEYYASIRALKEKYQDQISIYLGFETEFIEGEYDFYKEISQECDYLILGPHFYKDYEHPSSRIDNLEDMKLYVEMLEKAMQSNYFTYIAHPDIFLCNTSEITDEIKEIIHSIARLAVKYHTVLEWNIEGYRDHLRGRIWPNGTTDGYPRKEFWEIIQQYPIEVILGSDAHLPESLNDQATKEAESIVQSLHLNIIDHIDLKS